MNQLVDKFHFTTAVKITKGTMLFIISQIYDPLGLLAPTTTNIKIMALQNSLDDEISDTIKSDWIKFVNTIQYIYLQNLQIPLYVMSDQN